MSTLSWTGETITILPEGRYDRQGLISWWDQNRVAGARVLVVGAGALGNEILKLLALTGIGHVMIYDIDKIELSNLSRTVLFRESDQGAFKAEVAAARLAELNPQIMAVGRNQNIVSQVGQGIFLWADIVICGLDNRLARMFVNSACAQTGRTWVDGAIEGLSGIVRVFDPRETACYECTMNKTDRMLVQERMSCAMLARDEINRGHVPTTAVSASLIAALEVQEAIKYLHGQPILYGEGVHINGIWGEFERIRYKRREDCLGHQFLGPILRLERGIADICLGELLELAETRLGDGATLELSRDVITSLTCPNCGFIENCGVVLGVLREADAVCPHCQTHRRVNFAGTVMRDGEVDLSLTPADIGIPPFDIVIARRSIESHEAWLFDGDANGVLGNLAGTFDATRFNATSSSAERVSRNGL